MKIIKEFNEFTWDIVRGIPTANFYRESNIPFRVECKPGLGELYRLFSSEVEEVKYFDDQNDTYTYNQFRPNFTLKNWSPPNLRKLFVNNIFSPSKPVIIIQNKYTKEWNSGPFNFFDLDTLQSIINTLSDKFTIVYFRPDGTDRGYYKDENEVKEFNDYTFLRNNFPQVVLFKDILLNNLEYSYNFLQFMVSSSCDKFITVSGGNACVSLYFGKEVIIFDSPLGPGSGRGIWKTDSWLSLLNGAKIYGVNSYDNLITKVQELWTS
jgi:hypothetical protein